MLFALLSLLGAAIFTAGAIWMGDKLIAHSRQSVLLPPIHPQRQPEKPVQSIQIPSESGASLAGWYLQHSDPRGVVVLMHGLGNNRNQTFQRALFLHSQGFSTMLFDFQAHGESEGDFTTFGYLESLDARSAVYYMKERYPDHPLVVVGISMGGASALLGLEDHHIDALVIEAVYTNIHRAIGNRLALRLGRPGRWLTPVFTQQLKYRLGIHPRWLSPVDKICGFRKPLLVIGGKQDPRTLEVDTRLLYETAASEHKELWLIEDADHTDFHDHDRRQYEQRLSEFLNRHIPEKPKQKQKSPQTA